MRFEQHLAVVYLLSTVGFVRPVGDQGRRIRPDFIHTTCGKPGFGASNLATARSPPSKLCENATAKSNAQVMTASPISCRNVELAWALPARCFCTSSKLPVQASRPWRHLLQQAKARNSPGSTHHTHRPIRSRRSSAVYAVVSTAAASANSGVSLLFAASTLYCIPLFALVSTQKCCCNSYLA